MTLPKSVLFRTGLAKRLTERREALGLSQSQLAKRMKRPPAQISHYECGVNQPNAYSLRDLAESLDTSVDYFLGLTTNPKPR